MCQFIALAIVINLIVSACTEKVPDQFIDDFNDYIKLKNYLLRNQSFLFHDIGDVSNGVLLNDVSYNFNKIGKNIVYDSINRTAQKIKISELRITKAGETFFIYKIDEGHLVNKVFSIAYLPSDSVSEGTSYKSDMTIERKLQPNKWYLVSWVTGID